MAPPTWARLKRPAKYRFNLNEFNLCVIVSTPYPVKVRIRNAVAHRLIEGAANQRDAIGLETYELRCGNVAQRKVVGRI